MWDSLKFEGGTKRFKDIMQTVTATPYEAGEENLFHLLISAQAEVPPTVSLLGGETSPFT